MVIFRGINLEYFSSNSVSDKQRDKLTKDWKLNTGLFTILLLED